MGKRTGKNRKRNWNKAETGGVDEFVQSESQRIVRGGDLTVKKSEDLFVIDSLATDDVDGKKKRMRMTPEEIVATLKCESILRDFSTQPPPIKTHAKTRAKRLTLVEKSRQGHVTQKQIVASRARGLAGAVTEKRRGERHVLPIAQFDLWAEKVAPKEPLNEYLEHVKPHELKVPRREKPSILPAIEPPHGGSSYNPSFSDHQQYLTIATTVEVVKKRKEDRIDRNLMTLDPVENPEVEYWREMRVGLFEELPEPDLTDIVRDEVSANVVDREKKKSKQQRTKALAHKEKLRLAAKRKRENVTTKDFSRLRTLNKQVRKDEAATAQVVVEREAKKASEKGKTTSRLGRARFEAEELPVALSHELTGSLRTTKPEGNLLTDRFKSLQRRNVIETRTRAKFSRKYKQKKFTKTTHKAA